MSETLEKSKRYVEQVDIKYECVLCHRTFLTSYLKAATRCPWCEGLSLKRVEKTK